MMSDAARPMKLLEMTPIETPSTLEFGRRRRSCAPSDVRSTDTAEPARAVRANWRRVHWCECRIPCSAFEVFQARDEPLGVAAIDGLQFGWREHAAGNEPASGFFRSAVPVVRPEYDLRD